MNLIFQRIFFFLIFVCFLTGCGKSAKLSNELIKNAVYDISGTGKIVFENGTYTHEQNDSSGQLVLYIGQIDLFAYGDLNGDGEEDALTFLSSRFGGPEIFLSMEIFLNDNGVPVHSGGKVLGDRVAIDSVVIHNQIINLYLITQRSGDAMCCPTLHVKKMLQYSNNQLIELSIHNKGEKPQ